MQSRPRQHSFSCCMRSVPKCVLASPLGVMYSTEHWRSVLAGIRYGRVIGPCYDGDFLRLPLLHSLPSSFAPSGTEH